MDCIPDDAYVVINISGASPGLTNMSLATLENHRDRVIYNFYEANSLTLAGIGVEGTVLAPNADINNPQGVIKGQLVAKSWNGMMQINNHLFEGQVVVGNQPPIANDAEYEISSDESVSFELSASDLNNDFLNYQVNATSLLGELTGTAPNFTLTPCPGFTGIDQFSFLVNDGAFNSVTATVSFYVGRTQCELFPFALEGEQFLSLQVGQQVENYATSVGAGNYSLLTWDGSNDTNTLATSFVMPGDSFNYVNPDDVNDQDINIGDWVQGAPGKNNAKHVRNALDDLLGHEITVPLWSEIRGSGSQLDYQVVDFARIELTSYKLNGQSNIGFIYHGKADCGNFAPFTLDAEIATNKNESIAFVLGVSNEVIDGVQNLMAVINSDQDPLTFEIVTEPLYGTLSGSGPEFTYVPNNDFVGIDTFEFKVNDGYVDSNVSTVTIEVIQTNLSPMAFDQSLQD